MPRTSLLGALHRMTQETAGAQGATSEAENLTTVYRLPSEYHRKLILTMCDRMDKQIQAAKNTAGAIDDAAPHAFDNAQRATDDLRRIFSVQLDGFVAQPDPQPKTPIEEAIEQADAEPFEALHADGARKTTPVKITGGDDGPVDEWASDVPEPRPRVGGAVRYPDGSTRNISDVVSYDYERGSFGVRLHDGSLAGGPANIYYAAVGKEWRDVALMSAYDDAPTRSEPASVSDNAPGNAASTSLDDYGAAAIDVHGKARKTPKITPIGTGRAEGASKGKGASKAAGKSASKGKKGWGSG